MRCFTIWSRRDGSKKSPRHFHTEVFLIAGDEYCFTTSRSSSGWNHICGYSNSVFRPRHSNQADEMHSGCCRLWALFKLHIIQDITSYLLFSLSCQSSPHSCGLLEEKGSTSLQRTVIMWCMLKLKPKYRGLVQRLVMSVQLSCSSCCVQVLEAGVTCSHETAPQYKCCTGPYIQGMLTYEHQHKE